MTKERPLILILDRDTAVRASLKFALELEGLTVVGCATREDLLGHARLHQARCVVLDGRSLGVQTFDVLKELKAVKLKVPVILVVSSITEGIRRRAKAAGASYVIEKPFLDSALLEAIQDAIPGKQP